MSEDSTTKKIVAIGSANVDFIMKLPRLPKVGESVTNGQFMQTYGGKGANQAVAVSRAGGNVWFVNCVGADNYGTLIRKNLVDAGIHTEYVHSVDKFNSGIAVVLIGEQGKNLPTIDPGANYALMPEMILSLREFMRDAAIMVLQYEMPAETCYAALALAKELAIPIVFNFAPPQAIDKNNLSGIDYLIVNETEAEFLFGYPVGNPESIHKAAQDMLGLGAKTAIITLGDNGVYLAQKEWSELIPAFSVDAVDSTGAGDTFCGTFAVALTEGMPILEAVRFANAAAALCVTQLGAQPSIPTREAIEYFLGQQEGK